MEIHTELAFKVTREDVLPIDIQQTLLCQSSEADNLVNKPSEIDNILNNL